MSAPARDACDDGHPAIATGRGSIPERKERKLWEAGDVEVGANKIVVDLGLG